MKPEETRSAFRKRALEPPELPGEWISRRRFLSLLSTTTALAMGTSCSRIDRDSIVPYTRKPQEIIPGVATYYVSTFQEGLAAYGVLVKTREGRPIHVEGNGEHPHFQGKTSYRAIADVLSLYDADRLQSPVMDGKRSGWTECERRIASAFIEAGESGKSILLMTGAIVSPTRWALLEDLKRVAPNLRHAAWEPAADQAELSAQKALYGEIVHQRFHLERAEVVLSFQADFLGVDGNVPEATRQFASRRRPGATGGSLSRLWVVEGGMSLTGTNADHRLPARPSQAASLAFALARDLHETHGLPLPAAVTADALSPFGLDTLGKETGISPDLLRRLSADLARAGENALVLAGPAIPKEAHVACHLLNGILGGEGHTVEQALAPPPVDLLTLGEVHDLLDEAVNDSFAAAIFWGVNPAHAFPDLATWKEAVEKIPLRARIGLYEDETSGDCQIVLPEYHWLEAWGDYQHADGLLSLAQPTIGPLYDSKQGEDILLELVRALGVGEEAPDSYHAYLKDRWRREVYPEESPVPFEQFWNAALHDGVLAVKGTPRRPPVLRGEPVNESAAAAAAAPAEGMELILTIGSAVYDGRYANNGWLEELPHPVTKVTWGNVASLAAVDAERLGLGDGDVVRLGSGEEAIQVPVLVQPGQAPGVVSLELGYGRRTGRVAAAVGVNAYPLQDITGPSPFWRTAIELTPVGERRTLPRTQEHHRMEGRDLARYGTLEEIAARDEIEHDLVSLHSEQPFPDNKWGMVIDLSACVGCGACIVACQSENNIPVVGPESVSRGREMHWIRIDRYYEGDLRDPRVVHQPILCQHCDNAPCETVCPVNATVHSPDGLNQMVYNRCVGTRYCANNCPYKVRRFNFFDFTGTKTAPENLAFNPEVSVRPRGVMEKCTFCVQRIQDVRQRAKSEKRPIGDGEIRPACAVACPADAIVFGDLNDPESEVARLTRDERGYKILEELGVRPSVTYLAAIVNPGRGD